MAFIVKLISYDFCDFTVFIYLYSMHQELLLYDFGGTGNERTAPQLDN